MSRNTSLDRLFLFLSVSAACPPLVACTDQNSERAVDGAAVLSGASDAGAGANDGGPRSDAPASGLLACDDPGDAINPAAVLSDFEDGSAQLPNRQGRIGAWWVSGDMTPGGVAKPLGEAAPEVIPQGGRCGSTRALHVTGSGFLDWGADVSVTFNWGATDAGADGARAWNGSAYQGLTFWARLGATSGSSVRFALADQYERPEGGFCTVDGSGPGCWDTFGVDLPYLDTTWRKYKIYFSDLTQRGFGYTSPKGKLDTSALYQFQLELPAGAIFDLWFDDPTFF